MNSIQCRILRFVRHPDTIRVNTEVEANDTGTWLSDFYPMRSLLMSSLFLFLSSNMDHSLRRICKPRVEPILARVIPLHSMVAVAILCRFSYYSCKAGCYKHRCIANSYFSAFVGSLQAFNGLAQSWMESSMPCSCHPLQT